MTAPAQFTTEAEQLRSDIQALASSRELLANIAFNSGQRIRNAPDHASRAATELNWLISALEKRLQRISKEPQPTPKGTHP